MAFSFLPQSEAELVAWSETFTHVAEQNLPTLKMTARGACDRVDYT